MKLRAASAARVRDNKPATVAEARECWQNAHTRALHWEAAIDAAGGDLAFELLDLIRSVLFWVQTLSKFQYYGLSRLYYIMY